MKRYRMLFCFVVLALLAVGASARQSHKACCDNRKPEKAKAKIKGYHGPQSLGPLSLDTPHGSVPLRSVLSILGLRTGQHAAVKGDETYLCFADKTSGLFIVLERGADDLSFVRGITLSQWGMCPASTPMHAVGFANWSTREGIRIGSSEEDVLKAYGKPSVTLTALNHQKFSFLPEGMKPSSKPVPPDAKEMGYHPPDGEINTDFAYFGIADHHVVWMTVSDNE